MTQIERFWNKVEVVEPDSCWEWTGSKNQDGYGNFKFDGKTAKAHRVSYLLTKGVIPIELIVRHSCHNTSCVNPNHLSLGTQKDNMKDCREAGRFVYTLGNQTGENHNYAKLNEEKVKFIHKSNQTNAELARLFNVNPSTISSVRKGKNWSHLYPTGGE